MRPLADFAIALADLVRIELRHGRQVAVQTGVLVTVCIVAGVLMLLGIFGILMGLYFALALRIGAPAAALLTGIITMFVGALLLWFSKRIAR